MGSSKSANSLMVEYNYRERGQKVLLAKTNTDTRNGQKIIYSRIGLSKECILLSEVVQLSDQELADYDAVIVDEIQFADPKECDFLAHIVDDLNIPVMTYGLRTDFQLHFFPGSQRMMELADEIHEIKTMCWCGRKAICNARYNKDGIVREGEQVMLGANDEYIALCRKHFLSGELKRADNH